MEKDLDAIELVFPSSGGPGGVHLKSSGEEEVLEAEEIRWMKEMKMIKRKSCSLISLLLFYGFDLTYLPVVSLFFVRGGKKSCLGFFWNFPLHADSHSYTYPHYTQSF